MATADQLVELMFSWIEQRENCAEQLKKLADELKTFREKCNAAECVGSSVSVVGAASLIGAGVATFFTGGAAAPFLAVLGTTYGVVGTTVSVTAKIIEHFLSSDALKDAEKIEKKNNKTAEKIQNLFEQLKAEVKEMYPSADPDQVDRHVMTSFVRAVARRSGLKLNSLYLTELGIRQISINPAAVTAVLITVCGIFTVFALRTVGKQSKFLIAEGTQQLIRETSAAGLKTALKGGAMVVGGAVGMGFALHEAIGNWKDLIKNKHETEASRSLRDTADDILKMCRTIKKQFDNMRMELEEMDRRQLEEEKARRQREREEKLLRGNFQRLGLLVVCSLAVYLVFSYYRGNIMSSNPVQEKSVNLMTETDQRHVMEHFDQCEQTGREQQKDSDSYSPEEESKQTCKKKSKNCYPLEGLKCLKTIWPQIQTVDQCEINQTPPGTIRIGLLNTRLMNQSTSRISELITQTNLDVLLRTETWLRDDTADRVLSEASPGFSFHYQVRTDGRRGGGVANQFSEELQGEQIHFDSLNIETFEFVVTVLQHDFWDQPVVIINLYHPPGNNQEEFCTFLNEFESLLDEVKKKYSSIIVAGDFNIHVNKESRSFTDEFEFLLWLYKLTQHVEEPTHRGGNTLDLVITTNVEISGLIVRDDDVADHYTVYFNAKPKDTRKKTEENKNEEQKGFRKTEE